MQTGTELSPDYEFDEPGFRRRVFYRSEIGSIGKFRCKPFHDRFTNTRPTAGSLVVFPRTCVQITHPGRTPIHADSNVVLFYNRNQQYFRRKISERGDYCDVFRFEEKVVASAIERLEPVEGERAEHLFKMTHGPSEASTYLFQRSIYKYAKQSSADPMLLDESLLRLLERTTKTAYRHWYGASEPKISAATREEHVQTVGHAQFVLARDFEKKLSLDAIANEVYSSPFHLCRLFRKHTGHTIHQYLTQLRLRTALEYLESGDFNLMQLALRLGFSSHSHFCAAFKKHFSITPSDIKGKRTIQSLLKEHVSGSTE